MHRGKLDLQARNRGYAPQTDAGVRAGLAAHGAAPGGASLMESERLAATWAIEMGMYCVWRSDDARCVDFCSRIGRDHRCFCGHRMRAHDVASLSRRGQPPACVVENCRCTSFDFIPSRPEEVGDWHLLRRRGFDVRTWTVKCRCGHSHTKHARIAGRARRCRERGCQCSGFDAPSQCVVCERPLRDHRTVVETERERRERGLPVGEAYLPLHGESESTRAAVFGGGGGGAVRDFELERALRPAFGGGIGGGFSGSPRTMQTQRQLGDAAAVAWDGSFGFDAAEEEGEYMGVDDRPTRGRGRMTAEENEVVADFQRRLTAFFSKAAPAKLWRVPELALKYAANETRLWLILRRRYPSFFCGERAAEFL